MTDLKLLIYYIVISGLKKKDIADKLGVTYQCLKKKLDGESEFTVPEINALCDILNITNDEEKIKIFFAKQSD